jgi:uncharacterized protein
MLTEPKAAAREVTVSGVLAMPELSRLKGILATDNGRVEAQCAFGRDEEGRFVVTVSVDAEVEVRCQRCLESMTITVQSENRLGIVGDDDLARQLPSRLEPWVVEEEQGNLWVLVEDDVNSY